MSQITQDAPKPYRIISGCDPEKVNNRVRDLLQDGYVLYGSLNMAVDAQANRHFSQVMVLPGIKSADIFLTLNRKIMFQN